MARLLTEAEMLAIRPVFRDVAETFFNQLVSLVRRRVVYAEVTSDSGVQELAPLQILCFIEPLVDREADVDMQQPGSLDRGRLRATFNIDRASASGLTVHSPTGFPDIDPELDQATYAGERYRIVQVFGQDQWDNKFVHGVMILERDNHA